MSAIGLKQSGRERAFCICPGRRLHIATTPFVVPAFAEVFHARRQRPVLSGWAVWFGLGDAWPQRGQTRKPRAQPWEKRPRSIRPRPKGPGLLTSFPATFRRAFSFGTVLENISPGVYAGEPGPYHLHFSVSLRLAAATRRQGEAKIRQVAVSNPVLKHGANTAYGGNS